MRSNSSSRDLMSRRQGIRPRHKDRYVLAAAFSARIYLGGDRILTASEVLIRGLRFQLCLLKTGRRWLFAKASAGTKVHFVNISKSVKTRTTIHRHGWAL